jgi:signal transduction histidine kinase
MSSLRTRLVLGAFSWMVGLIVATHFTVVALLPYGSGPVLHFGALTVVALGLLAAGLLQLRVGLRPIERLRARLAAVREGRSPRVEGRYPDEVQPLVDDLNALLADRENRVARAQAKAGDLAHGLKTPLAVLAQEAARARGQGLAELAASLEQQVERMRLQVEYQLAHARASASGPAPGTHADLGASAAGLARTLARLHAERGVVVDVSGTPGLAVRVEPADLDEMLGNLLDNACKWARGRVRLTATAGDGWVRIDVVDDGPGLAPELRERVLQRGVRADEAQPGSGLGLAIVRDLAEIYGGSLELDGSGEGGLRATLRLPAA